MNKNRFLLSSIALSVIVGLSACGGGGSNSDSTLKARSNATTTGTITAFGSIFVNGVEYNTQNAKIIIEGKTLEETDLKLGMMVSVTKGPGDMAIKVEAGDEVEGIVNAVIPGGTPTGILMVMGQTVTIDDSTIFESKVTEITIAHAGEIKENNVVEVHGYSTGMGEITATRIEVKAISYTIGDELEVTGYVMMHDLDAKTFKIGTLEILYTDSVLVDLPNGLTDDLLVEVKSTEGLVNNQLIASKVEPESIQHDTDEDDEVEVKDLISEIIPDVSITVADVTFLIDADTEFDPQYDATTYDVGVLVEVEGTYNAAGELVAKKIELEDNYSDTIKADLAGMVIAVDATDVNIGTITLAGGIVVMVNNDTIMKDSSSVNLQMFNLEDIFKDDYLAIKAIGNGNGDGTYTALKVKREDTPMM